MATKPMVGCLDAITHTEEAVREMVGGLAYGDVALAPRRSRSPQPLGPDGRMMPSTAETACGALLLAQLPLLKVCVSCLFLSVETFGGIETQREKCIVFQRERNCLFQCSVDLICSS